MRSPDTASGEKAYPWIEYITEAAGLGLFMISASAFGVLLEHPSSPVRVAIESGVARRGLMGLAMALTAVVLIYSPWGRRSGAHFNPAVTLTFYRLGKVGARELVGYIVAQFVGGAAGMGLAVAVLGRALAHPSINYVVTAPGASGSAAAFLAEVVMAWILMGVVLNVSSRPALARWTGICAGVCVAVFVLVEAPLSGMSLNPARSLASAVVASDWRAAWVYFSAPPIGMAIAAMMHTRLGRRPRASCAKLVHRAGERCIFCEWQRSRPADRA